MTGTEPASMTLDAPPTLPETVKEPTVPDTVEHPSEPAASPPSTAPPRKEPLSPGRRVSKRIKIRRRSQPTPKFLRDVITVEIPLNVTADLKIAIERTRLKRIKSLYKKYPALKRKIALRNKERLHQDDDNSNADDPMDEDEASAKDPSEGKENNKPTKKKKKILAHVPQKEQYGSVLDYLEAKYVKGVMLGDDDADGESMEDGSEGQGSVYSGGSFLDDTDLQRDVAEQVMANTTLTKLELEDEDGEFFVNVGNLEVEDNQYGEDYDPLQDKDKATKKRKKVQVGTKAPTDEAATKNKKQANEGDRNEDTLAKTAQSKKSISSTGPKKTGDKPATSTDPGEKALINAAKKARKKSDDLFQNISSQVKEMTAEELPRRVTKAMVNLTCPEKKKPGDVIVFVNPHFQGQRLRVKIPKDCMPGGSFRVSVPVKQDPVDEDEEKDHNKFSVEFKDLVGDYATAYDEWCRAQAAVDKSFALLKEKQAKYDPVAALFPAELMSPITSEYLKRLVRRARQNRYKRKKPVETESKEGEELDDAEEEEEKNASERRIVNIPTMGLRFPSIIYKKEEFDYASIE